MRRPATEATRDNPLRQIADRISASDEVVRVEVADLPPRPHPVTATTPPTSPRRGRSGIMRALSSPAALRRAILVAEILGPPKALQQPGNTRNTRSR